MDSPPPSYDSTSIGSDSGPGGFGSSVTASSSDLCTQYTHNFEIADDGKHFSLTSTPRSSGLQQIPFFHGMIIDNLPHYPSGVKYNFQCQEEQDEWDKAWAGYVSKHPEAAGSGAPPGGLGGPTIMSGETQQPLIPGAAGPTVPPTSLSSLPSVPGTSVCLQVTEPGGSGAPGAPPGGPPGGPIVPVQVITPPTSPPIAQAQVIPDETGDKPVGSLPVATEVRGGKSRQQKSIKGGGAKCFSQLNLESLTPEELTNLQKYILEKAKGGKTKKRKNKKRITKKQKRKRNNTKRKYNNKYGKFSIRKKSKLRRHTIRNKK